jgi:hypothetical protein
VPFLLSPQSTIVAAAVAAASAAVIRARQIAEIAPEGQDGLMLAAELLGLPVLV